MAAAAVAPAEAAGSHMGTKPSPSACKGGFQPVASNPSQSPRR